MRDLHVIVNNKIATYLSRDGSIVCRNKDYQIVFSFDSEWDAYGMKVARFIWNDKYQDVPFTGNTVAVPEISNTNQLEIGVYAGDLSTTTPAVIDCNGSILCKHGLEKIPEPTPELYRQILAECGMIAARVDNLATLKEGSTTGDAELQDIRVGYDGKSYGNAGEAVREQIAETHEKIGMIATFEKVPIEIDPSEWQPVNVIENAEWTTGVFWADNAAFETSQYYTSVSELIPAEPNATYKYSNFFGTVRVYDKNNVYLEKHTRPDFNTTGTFTVCADAAYLGVSCRYAGLPSNYPQDTWELNRTTPTEEELTSFELRLVMPAVDELREDVTKIREDVNEIRGAATSASEAAETARTQASSANEKIDMLAVFEEVRVEIDPSEWQQVNVTDGVTWTTGVFWNNNAGFDTGSNYTSVSELIPAEPNAGYKMNSFVGIVRMYDENKSLIETYTRGSFNDPNKFTTGANAAYLGVSCQHTVCLASGFTQDKWQLVRTTPTENELVHYELRATIPGIKELQNGLNELEGEFNSALPFSVHTADDLRSVTFNQSKVVFYDAAKSYVIPVEKNKKYRFIFSGKRNRTWIGGVKGSPFAAGLPAENIASADSGETEKTVVLECESGEYDYFIAGVAYGYTGDLTASVIYEVSDPVDGYVIKGVSFATSRDLREAFQSQVPHYVSSARVSVPAKVDGVYALYDKLVESYPHYVTKNTLGSNLFEYVFSTGNYNQQTVRRDKDTELEKPVVLILSGIHGREKAGIMSTYQLFADMCACNYHLFDLRENVTFKVIPSGNPNGYNNNTRGNANGVNINRNFDINWVPVEDTNNYAGESAADQTETQILQDWMDSNSTAKLYIDFHNSAYTDEVSWIAGDRDVENMAVLKKAFLQGVYDIAPYFEHAHGFSRDLIMAYTGYLPNAKGTSDKYAKSVGILSVCLECSEDQNNSGLNSSLTIKTGAECLGNMLRSIRTRTDLFE